MQVRDARWIFLFALIAPSVPTATLAKVIAPSQAKIDVKVNAKVNAKADPKSDEQPSTAWYDIRLLEVEGRGWNDTQAFYDRLPARAEGLVRTPVWGLSHDSAGMAVRFQTDATTIQARWTVKRKRLALFHMPATGASGLDLYVRLPDRTWRWLGIGRPKESPTNEVTLVRGLPAGKREYMLYLPLYNGVTSVEIGIAKKDRLETGTPRPASHAKPLVFWGTSITQGACASRTGMAHTAILGRRLNRPVINLGFSGNGKMEPEMAQLLAELDPAVYILDCLPNLVASEVKQRTEPVVRILRKSHPETPILLVEDNSYAHAFLVPEARQRNLTSRTELAAAYQRLKKAGVKHLYYLTGDQLLGQDGESTVDGTHPTNLGFMRLAAAMEKTLVPILD